MSRDMNYKLDTEQGEKKKTSRKIFFQVIPLLPSEKLKDQQTSLHPVQSSTHHGHSSEHVE
jgi:hypothetical protein